MHFESMSVCPSVHVRDTERGMRDKGWVKKKEEQEGGTGRGRTERTRERDRQKRRTGDSRWE